MKFEGFLNDDWSFLKSTSWSKLKKRIDRLHIKCAKLVARVESHKLRSVVRAQKEQLTSINNSKCIPYNATIRNEYTACGRSNCSQPRHGPYYYAYWKDSNGKLKKKYIGKYPPPLENPNKGENHSNDLNESGNSSVT